MAFNLDDIVRPNIKNLKPYSSARDEFSGSASVFLDANENSFGSPLTHWYNRYPDPLQKKLKERIAEIKGVRPANMLLGNGSDECIDLLFRAFCEPGIDNVLICPPTYGMYEVSASINNVAVKKQNLTQAFQLDLPGIEAAIDDNTKMIFLCSPNNPTGNSLIREDIEIILNNYFGIVVIDEAYINFSRHRSFIALLEEYPNLVVLQTFSKAWGLAALRLGICFANTGLINILNRIKPPYNISQPSQNLAIEALKNVDQVNEMIMEIVSERKLLIEKLSATALIKKIYPSDANFILVQVESPTDLYQFLIEKGIVVRDRSRVERCEGCLRITVGTANENQKLLEAMDAFAKL